MPVYIFFPETDEEFEIDHVESITPTYAAELTKKRVEDGGNINDNRNRQPTGLSVSGFMTDVPLDATGEYAFDSEGNHTKFKDRMLKAEEMSEYLIIDTGLVRGFYENMQITSLSFPWDVEAGSGVPFELQLERVRLSKTKVLNLFKSSSKYKATQAKFQAAIDQGKTAAKALSASVSEAVKKAATSPTGGLYIPDWFR